MAVLGSPALFLFWEVCSKQITGFRSLPGAAALAWAGSSDCRDRGLSCAPAVGLWSRTRHCSRCLGFFNLHFLNYSESCQVHSHNRKVTNRAVVLQTRSADAVTLILELLRRERGSGLDHLLPALWSESGWHDAFSGRKPDKTLFCTGDLAVQAVPWNPVHSRVWDPGSFPPVTAGTLIEARTEVNVHSACKLLLPAAEILWKVLHWQIWCLMINPKRNDVVMFILT